MTPLLIKTFRPFLLLGLLVLSGAVPAAASGRSEDPREAEARRVGTDADPAIRQSDRSLQQLLFTPVSAAASPASPPAADHPAAGRSKE